MPRNSESQTRAAHRRFHTNRGIVKSSCAICRAENPNLGVEVVLEGTNPVQILLPAPPRTIPPEEQWQRDRLYRLAALSKTVEEVAIALGMSVEALHELVMTQFQTTWSSLSERASVEVQLEVESQIFERARVGDFRFTMLYSKLRGLPGFYENMGNVRVLPTPALKNDLAALSTDELIKMRADLSRVIDRPRRFVDGPLSDTVRITDSTKPFEAPEPVTIEPGSDQAVEREVAAGVNPYTGPMVIPEPEPEPERRPVTYCPEPGLLQLGSGVNGY
jgi:hypothetical protein